MIPVGTKIIVLASSTSRSGARPRRGSIGYILSIGKTDYFSKLNMFITPARIVFTRFGYEKIRRSEPKFVTLIHPSSGVQGVVNIQKFLNKLVNRSLDSTTQLREIFKKNGANISKINSIVVYKTNIETDVSTNRNEFKSWILSIMHGGYLHPLVMLDKNSPFNKVKESLVNELPDFSNEFRKCIKYRGASNLVAEKLFDNTIDRQRIIRQLKQYTHLCIRKEVSNINNDIKSVFMSLPALFDKLYYLMNIDRSILDKININFHNERIYKLITDWSHVFKYLNK